MQNIFWLSPIIDSSKHKKHKGRDNQDSPKINIIYSCRSRWGSWPLKHSIVSSTYTFKNAIFPIKKYTVWFGVSGDIKPHTSLVFNIGNLHIKSKFLGGNVFSEIEKTFLMQCKQCIWELQPTWSQLLCNLSMKKINIKKSRVKI